MRNTINILLDMKKARREIFESTKNLRELEAELKKHLYPKFDQVVASAEDLKFGFWQCYNSPTGKCIYADPLFDNCLICNNPHERK